MGCRQTKLINNNDPLGDGINGNIYTNNKQQQKNTLVDNSSSTKTGLYNKDESAMKKPNEKARNIKIQTNDITINVNNNNEGTLSTVSNNNNNNTGSISDKNNDQQQQQQQQESLTTPKKRRHESLEKQHNKSIMIHTEITNINKSNRIVLRTPRELKRVLLNNKYYIPWSNISVNNVIALGSVSKVFNGKFQQKIHKSASSPRKNELHGKIKVTNKEVALKRFFRINAGIDREAEKEIFFSEIRILQKLSHPSIIQYFGTTFSHPFYWIVTEFCENGNLETRLLHNKNVNVTSAEIYTVLSDVMQGIEYLHNLVPKIVHRDIKPSNILIRKDGHAVLGDFGYAIELHTDTRLSSRLGSPAYVAPEIFLGRKYNHSIDVYAFGIVMWELLNRRIPYDDMISDSMESMKNLMQYVCLGGRLIIEDNTTNDDINNKNDTKKGSNRPNSPFVNSNMMSSSPPPNSKSKNSVDNTLGNNMQEAYNILMESCWHQLPSERPSANNILLELRRIFANLDGKAFNKYKDTVSKLPSVDPSPQLQLLRSMKEDDKFEAGLLLISGATLNSKTPDGWNILHENIAMGNRKAIKFILGWKGEEKIDLNTKTVAERLSIIDLAKYCERPKITLDIFYATMNNENASYSSNEEKSDDEDSNNDITIHRNKNRKSFDVSDSKSARKLEFLCTACETYITFTRMHDALMKWKKNTKS